MKMQAVNAPEFLARPNINALNTQEKSALVRRIFEEKRGAFQRIFGDDVERKEFECEAHSQAISQQLYQHLKDQQLISGDKPLNELHLELSDELRAYGFNDGVNGISKHCYDMPAAFTAAYLNFIKEVLFDKIIQQPFYFQETPTLRIHCPNGENSHHYPRFHSDIGYGHPPGEINIWLPLTSPEPPQLHGFRISNLNTTRNTLKQFDYDFVPLIEQAIHSPEFNAELSQASPQVSTDFGSMLMFDSRLLHSGEPLVQHTRASMDIRIILCEDFARDDVLYQGAGRRKVIFAPGYCYASQASTQL